MPPSASSALPAELPYGRELTDRILEAFQGRIRPVAVSWLYRIALLVVAFAMVLLPLIYLALIAAAGYGVYYHATHHLSLFEQLNVKGALIAYGGPLVIGVILVFFMIKPLFARPARREQNRSLRREDEPLLFAYVGRVCESVGAPLPRRIDVDCQVNASASFRRGILSLFGRDLVLTLGMPLVAGLSLQELTGVLAHEFGHFAQGAGMRLTYVIRSVNHWFMRVVFERDQFDVQLEEAARSSGYWAITLVVRGAKLMVWITRGILRGLMWLGHGISCFMLRQMEFDADRYEARMVGSTAFESTCRELSNLGLAYQKSLSDLGSSWQDGRLADSLPGLVRVNRLQFDDTLIRRIQEAHVDKRKTGIFDTHPADKDRIASAHREGDDPVFRSDLPATAVFRDFDRLASEVSLDFYRSVLGDRVRSEDLHAVAEIASLQERSTEEARSRMSFFQGVESVLRPIEIPAELGEAPDRETAVGRLEEARNTLLDQGASYRRRLEEHDRTVSRRTTLGLVERLHELGFKYDPGSFELATSHLSEVLDEKARCEKELVRLGGPLAELEATAAERLRTALALAGGIPDLTEAAEALPDLLRAAAVLTGQPERVGRLHEAFVALGFLGRLQANSENAEVMTQVSRLSDEIHAHLSELRGSSIELPYPFEHADESISLGGFLVPEVPGEGEIAALHQALGEAVQRSGELYVRLLGRLGRVAERVESELGLERLPEPEDEEPQGD